MSNVHARAADWIEWVENGAADDEGLAIADEDPVTLAADLRKAGERCVPEGWELDARGNLMHESGVLRVAVSLGGTWGVQLRNVGGGWDWMLGNGRWGTWQVAIAAAEAAESETEGEA